MAITLSMESTTVAPVVSLTPTAIKQVLWRQKKQGAEGQHLRLGVRGGGCSGLSYVIEFDPEPDPEFDVTFEQDGVAIVVDIKSAKFLRGSTLDYNLKNLTDGGFVFDNPQSLRSCGCGTSFTAK